MTREAWRESLKRIERGEAHERDLRRSKEDLSECDRLVRKVMEGYANVLEECGRPNGADSVRHYVEHMFLPDFGPLDLD